VAEYVRVVCELREEWSAQEKAYFDPWFRGQANAEWGLQPNLYRLGLQADEDELRLEFKRRAAQLLAVEREPTNEWAWYFLMQHHGAPTRLLDWTDSALVALFFAVNSASPSNPSRDDAVVWALNPFWLNGTVVNIDSTIQTDWVEADKYLMPVYQGTLVQELPIAIDPVHTAKRISVQFSRFTIHGTRPDGLTDVAGETGQLRKLVIPARCLDRFRTDLRTCGIIDTAVFPDLEGLARDLVRFWKTPWPLP
jgi:hypothetical protein